MTLHQIITTARRLIMNSSVLSAGLAFSLMGTILFTLQGSLNDTYFDRIVAHTVTEKMSSTEKVLALMEKLHKMQWTFKEIVQPKGPKDAEPPPPWLPSAYRNLLDSRGHLTIPIGACGSFTFALAKALDRAGFNFRIVRMQCGGESSPGCHTLLEAKVDSRWVVLDPIFNQAFRRPDGKLASFDEVSKDWASYLQQIPLSRREAAPESEEHYDVNFYNYSGVTGTNWNKIPIVMPAIRALLVKSIGEKETTYFSLRSYIYDVNRVYSLFFLLGVFIFSILLGRSLIGQAQKKKTD